MVFPYINGGELANWLFANAVGGERNMEREKIAKRMGEEVGRMTKGRLINRDLKPSNWVIRYDRL